MKIIRKKLLGIFACMLLICATTMAIADWKEGDGHKMHFPQLPDPNGWDVNFHDWMLGDDWRCSESGPVTDVHFWISWRDDEVKDLPWVKVSIFSNDQGPPSKPAELLWSRQFTDDEFIIAGPWKGDQGWCHPPNMWYEHDHQNYYQINIINIDDPFEQEEGGIYWLVISAPFYEPDALGWKTSQNHWNDLAVFGTPGNWYHLKDPTGEPLDFAFVITGAEPVPDLVCGGRIVWTDVKPGDTVTDTFQVGNAGDPGSLLNWAVETATLPSWGSNWSFSPSSGIGLAAGGWTTVTVTVVAPNENNEIFTGEIKVINTDDASDTCKIDVSLTTPRNKPFNFLNLYFLRFLEQHPHMFPMLRQLLGL